MSSSEIDRRPRAEIGSARGFVAVWLPSVVVIVGTGGCLFTISWWLSVSPGGGRVLGLVLGLSSFVSLTVNATVSGVVDRRRRLPVVLALLLGLLVPLLALVALLGPPNAPVLVVVAVGVCYCLISSLETVFLGASETTAADLAPTHWPKTRIALLTQIHSQIDRIVAPAVAGALIAAGALRSIPTAAVALVLLVLGTALLARGHYRAVSRARELGAAPVADDTERRGFWTQLFGDARTAAGLIRRYPDLTFLVQFGILGNLVVFPFYAILPAFLGAYVTPGPATAIWFGRSAAAYGIGMLVGSGLVTLVRRDLTGRGALRAASWSLATICAVIFAVTLVRDVRLVVLGLGLVGALFSILVAVGGAVWLTRTPGEIRARVFSLRRLTVFSSIPIGTMLMGFAGSALGYPEFTRVLAVAVLALLAVAWIRFRRRAAPAAPAPTTTPPGAAPDDDRQEAP